MKPSEIDTTDFLPALQAVEQSAPHPLPRLMIGATASLLGIGLLWATFGQIDIVASAEGKLVPTSYVEDRAAAGAGHRQGYPVP